MKVAGPFINHREFQKMKKIPHHNDSVYDHVLNVAYQAYRVSYKKGWDWESTIRGALLHDFYLYQFNKKPRWSLLIDAYNHMVNHPLKAYENASKHFHLNPIEKDIIISHMFPVRVPKYKESWIVSLMDKSLAIIEYSQKFKKVVLGYEEKEESYQKAQ